MKEGVTMEAKEEKRKEKIIILIILILIILIFSAFLLIKCLGKIDNNVKMPTGNIDIFDIVFGDTSSNNDYCNCNCKCGCHNNSNNSNLSVNNNSPLCPNCGNNIDNNTGENNSKIIVYDNEQKYSVNTPLKIFTHTSYYVVNDVIAPASENSYQFVIRNNNNFNIKYNLEMMEENKYNINMKFRLKLNGVYVVGNDNTYVTASELNQYNMSLADNNYDVYTLDWKWIESDNDTEIGANINSNYKLNLKMSASQY